MSARPNMQPPPTRSGGTISILATIGLNYRPPFTRRPSGTPIVAIKAAGRVKTCPGARVPTERDYEVLAVAGPRINTGNNMRALLCPLHPAVHEARGGIPWTGQTPDG